MCVRVAGVSLLPCSELLGAGGGCEDLGGGYRRGSDCLRRWGEGGGVGCASAQFIGK